jgi:hypothetical protein
MNVNVKAVSLLPFFLALACTPPKPPAGEECDQAFGHLVDIGCEPAHPDSGTWVDVCRNGRRNGLFGLRCINAAPSRAALRECGVTCQ